MSDKDWEFVWDTLINVMRKLPAKDQQSFVQGAKVLLRRNASEYVTAVSFALAVLDHCHGLERPTHKGDGFRLN